MWKVKFYQTARGEFPVNKFVEGLEMRLAAKTSQSIDLLETHGPFLKPPYMKKLEKDLYELRIRGKVAIRIFYTVINNEYYLIHAFKKKSQKTPRKDLKVAIDRMKELI
ncbi:MAG: type II toxin-antitoxin system RelE/ParE family toxin [Candidatus Woesebacteria bacterium]|nr:type II toxin-antitoxin system RelE/ParE family toxin [Candidatus Woesebacteria bacterium]